jgi:alkaline phosphatase
MDGFEVMLGGGKRHFIPDTEGGKRKDGQDLINLWQGQGNDSWNFVEDKQSLSAVDAEKTEKLLGFFNASHMNFEADRPETDEPSLAEMTDKALDVLGKNEEGFFLMVEGGRVDHAHHSGNAYRALSETMALSDAVELTIEKLKEKGELDDTLIVVTADHSHTMTIAGYPKRGNPILGRSKNINNEYNLDLEGNPYTTLGYMNGGGYAYEEEDVMFGELKLDRKLGRQGEALADIEGVDTEKKNYFQEALVATEASFPGTDVETHAGEDVAIYAQGPLAYKFQGTLEENAIFHVINEAGRLEEQANAAVNR